MKKATVLLAVSLALLCSCNTITNWWGSKTPTEQYQVILTAYNAAVQVYSNLDEDQQEKVRPYKVKLKKALDAVKTRVEEGGKIDLTTLLYAFNQALADMEDKMGS